jgi:hypothetical protein
VALKNIASVIKPGGVVLIRDYAIEDEAELRFKPGHMIEPHFYTRQDGTFSRELFCIPPSIYPRLKNAHHFFLFQIISQRNCWKKGLESWDL